LIDWVKVLRPTRHKIGQFGDVLQANLLAWCGKTKPNPTKVTHSPIKTNVLQHKINTQKTKARFLVTYTTSGLETERAYSGFGTSKICHLLT